VKESATATMARLRSEEPKCFVMRLTMSELYVAQWI
jgi:hypothetical protein